METFLQKLKTSPESIEFADTMAVIEDNYDFTETEFQNGDLLNQAGQNSGSCKLFSFAKLQGLGEDETLACFGHYYRDDVLKNPEGDDHQNIRNFMKTGWKGVSFAGEALLLK